MPLRRDAAHPESDSMGGRGVDLGLPKNYILARGRMGLCAVCGGFVVPLGPAPPPPSVRHQDLAGATFTTYISRYQLIFTFLYIFVS